MSQAISDRPQRAPLVMPGGAELHASDMTATFAGDLTLQAAQQRLAALDQWAPIDGDPQQTLASLIDADSTGPLRLGYGAWRDLLLGVQFTNGRGELISAGGRTVKNVAGYDLTKFMVGQAGVFGRIVTVTTRTYLRPALALLARTNSDAQLMARLMPTPCRPHWAIRTPGHLLLGYLGERAMIDYQQSHLPAYGDWEMTERSLAEDQAHRAQLWQATGEFAVRASVPPALLDAFADGAQLRAWVADPAFGIVLMSAQTSAERDRIATAAGAVGGSIRSANPASAQHAFVTARAGERGILERLKLAFDPTGALNDLPWRSAT